MLPFLFVLLFCYGVSNLFCFSYFGGGCSFWKSFFFENIPNFITVSILIIQNSIILNYGSVFSPDMIILSLCHYRHIFPHNIMYHVLFFLQSFTVFHKHFCQQGLHYFYHYFFFHFPQHHQVYYWTVFFSAIILYLSLLFFYFFNFFFLIIVCFNDKTFT